MAAKKTKTEPTRPVLAEDVQSIAEPTRKPTPQAEKVPTPTIDPTLSSDNRHSSYSESSLDFPPDQGPQVEETPGKPKG